MQVKAMFAQGRLRDGQMNETEAAYAQTLEYRRRLGEILWYSFEGVTLKLATGCRYTPDFAVMLATGELQMHEVKGYWQDDAKAKIKVAAEKFPMKFIAVYKQPKRSGGGWKYEEF